MKNSSSFDLGLLIARLFSGGFMLTHGWPKLQKIFAGDFGFANPLGLGPEVSLILTVFAEFVCAILVLVGFRAKLATIPLMFTMLVAAFIIHWTDPIGKKEFPLLYFAFYAVIFLLGSGKYSIDGMLKKS